MEIIKKALIVAGMIILFIWLLNVFGGVGGSQEQLEDNSCLEGSHLIGHDENNMPICKLAPTGCPYADAADEELCMKLEEQQNAVYNESRPAIKQYLKRFEEGK